MRELKVEDESNRTPPLPAPAAVVVMSAEEEEQKPPKPTVEDSSPAIPLRDQAVARLRSAEEEILRGIEFFFRNGFFLSFVLSQRRIERERFFVLAAL